METTGIIHCENCGHRFKSRRSKTGYACEVWGYDDFACDVPLDGYCHKAKPARVSIIPDESTNEK